MIKKTKTKRKKITGWAHTKKIPHANHPAYFKKSKTNKDVIKYTTFTHSDSVDIDGEIIKTLKLKSNIDPNDSSDSYVMPFAYLGKRSELGKNATKFRLVDEDKELVESIIDGDNVIIIDYTSNSDKNKKKK